MAGYVVIVDSRLKPDALAAFRRLIDHNASASVRDEQGCRQFDVVLPQGEPDRVLLYEIHEDAAAFELHKQTPLFAACDRESAALVASKGTTLGRLAFAGTDG